jgi:hypothetical protein
MTVNQWVDRMNQTPTPGLGCFTATYPNLTWVQTPCSTEVPPPLGGVAPSIRASSQLGPSALPIVLLAAAVPLAAAMALLLARRTKPTSQGF